MIKNIMSCFIYNIILICLVTFGQCFADTEKCFINASIYYNIPVDILKAIADIESNNEYLAINISGKGYFPSTIEEAKRLLETDKSFDIGIMQINKFWFTKYGYDFEYGFNPCWNIQFGAYILAYEISVHGYTWDTIGRYHSPNAERRRKYIQKLLNSMK